MNMVGDNYIKLNVLRFSLNKSTEEEYHRLLEEEAIPHFKEKKNWSLVSEYAEILADYYSSIFQYKKSSVYYKLANDLRKNM